MDQLIHVEVLSRTGDVAQRVPLASLPATIGRAYDNDVIIDDPFVAPHHLRIERLDDGNLHVVDLGSRNGLHLTHPKRRVAEATIGGDERVRIGHTVLRFRNRDWPVPAEESDLSAEGWRSPLVTALALAAYLALLGLHTYSATIEDFQPARLLAGLPFALLVPAVWSGIWAAIGRLASGRASFFGHCTIILTGATTAFVVEPLLKLAAFAFSLPALAAESVIAIAFIIGAVLFGHLRLVSRLRPPILIAGSAAVVILAVTATQINSWLESRDDVNQISTMNNLYPPFLRVAPGETPEEFIHDSRDLEKPLLKQRDAAP
ncbi:MAG: FHA domain-containing protein [Burkholderiales bacterium]|nr:FHA domain-containing protein [Burkholderiales bacterium]